MRAAKCLGKFLIVSVLAAAVLILGEMSAMATTYYVSQSSGNDSWTGQTAKPRQEDCAV